MPSLVRFLFHRLLSVPVTLLVITMLLYGFVMLTPPEVRASLYFSDSINPDRLTQKQIEHYTDMIIQRYHLEDPYPVQYAYWAANLLRGDWGYSPSINDDVLSALIRRTSVTAELTLYSILLFIPLGLLSGGVAGWRRNQKFDNRFRLAAFIATSLPTFILALVLMAIFYVALGWFPPERLSLMNMQVVRSSEFHVYTGMMTIDGLLNGRVDISLDALRHLVLPVITLSLLHWATLARVTRTTIIDELQKDYVVAARARGLPERWVVWGHAFRNSLSPAITSSMLSAASLFTGVFIVEVIYNFKGISDVAVIAVSNVPDASAVLGFALYSVILVLLLMLALDLLQAIFDPRVREELVQ